MHCVVCGGAIPDPETRCLRCALAVRRSELVDVLRARVRSLDPSRPPVDEMARLLEAHDALVAARRRRAELRTEKRPWFVVSRWTLVVSIVGALVIGMPSTCIGEAIAKRPTWAFLLCPHVCADCRGPGVTVSWHEGVDEDSGSDHSRDFCDNDRIDVHASGFWSEGVDEDKHGDIEIPGWSEAFLTLGVFTAFFALTLAPLIATSRRRALARESVLLDARIADLEALVPDPVTDGSYR